MIPQLQQFISILSAANNPAKAVSAAAFLAYDVTTTLREEPMSAGMMKYHILGLPFDAVLHHFTRAEDEHYHDHPFAFTSYILQGGYGEKIIHSLNETEYVLRLPFLGSHKVDAKTIHKITSLYNDCECWTLILPEQWQQEPGFYRIEDGVMQYRQWNEEEWRIAS